MVRAGACLGSLEPIRAHLLRPSTHRRSVCPKAAKLGHTGPRKLQEAKKLSPPHRVDRRNGGRSTRLDAARRWPLRLFLIEVRVLSYAHALSIMARLTVRSVCWHDGEALDSLDLEW